MKKVVLFILMYCSSIGMIAANTSLILGNQNQNGSFSSKSQTQTVANDAISPNSSESEQIENLALLCKVWGFVKYHHPKIGPNKTDMDKELCDLIPQIKAVTNKEERNTILSNWVNSFGEITEFMPDSNFPDAEEIKLMPDYSWIDKNELGDALVAQLENIKKAVRSENNPYISFFPGVQNPDFSGEKTYSLIQYPTEQYRLVALFRYWNIIQYYYPNRHLIDDNWHDVLREFIPQFLSAKDKYEYKYSVLALWAKIKDTHAFIAKWDKVLYEISGYRNNSVPVGIKFVENKAVITEYLNQDLGKKTGLLPGDIIETIDGVSVEDIVKERLPITPGSNYTTQLRNIASYLLMSNNNEIQVKYKRNDLVETKTITCYSDYSVDLPYIDAIQTIDSDITYIYPGTIEESDYTPDKMKKILESKGMIIDMRCYPNIFMVFSFGKYLIPEPTQFTKITNTNYSYPGLFTYRDGDILGETNPDYFKGKIVIIVNEETQSQAEYTTMAFQTAPNVSVIGSTTAGADGNVSTIILPGNLQTYISGIGVYYPDGTETQRVGIVPDIEVKPTIEGIRNGIDEPLQKAIEIINSESGIKNHSADNAILLYPNPVTEGFYIKGANVASRVSVSDMQGRTVFVGNVSDSDGYVNIGSLSRGTYIVRIEIDNRIIQKKIIKM